MSRENVLADKTTNMDTLWHTIFESIRIIKKRKIVYANVDKPMIGNRSRTTSTWGFQVEGDETVRNKSFKNYVHNRMDAVRFLRRKVPYLRFKHASLESKQAMCLPRFELSDTSSYFFQLLVRHFGDDFKNLQTPRPGIRYLGKPGRQGVALLIEDESSGLHYVFKLAHSVGHAGLGKGVLTRGQKRKNRKTYGQYVQDGALLGFISQAKMQMISAMHNCTVPVYACGVADDTNVAEELRIPVSFMVMPPLKMLAYEYILKKRQIYSPELVCRHFGAKYYNLMLRMDTHVGILHRDHNHLNVMVDEEDDVLLIDFDRAIFVSHQNLQRWGMYPNITIAPNMTLRSIAGRAEVDRLVLQRAFNTLRYKNEDKDDDDIALLNTPQTPAEVPPLPYKKLSNGWTAKYTAGLPETIRRPIFGVHAYTNLRF